MSSASLFSAKLLNASLFRFEVLGSRAAPTLGAKGRLVACLEAKRARCARQQLLTLTDLAFV
jgi:hypothetical protein